MKKLYTIILVVLSLFAFTSCNDFLDMKPTNSVDSKGSISTARDAEVAINGLIREMLSTSLYGRNTLLYADAKGGDYTVVSNGRGSDGLYTFSHTSVSGTYSGFWSVGYTCIAQINSVLESIDAVEKTGTKEDFSDAKGQLYTYRAMIYFDLVRMYGKDYNVDKAALAVPLVTSTLATNEKPSRATVNDIYTQIVNDLTTGAGLIGKDANNGYINYYGNLAIQARVDMEMGKYAEALAICKEIIKDGDYSLYSNSEWVDSWKKQFGSESIIEFAVNINEADHGSSCLGETISREGDCDGDSDGLFVASDFWLARMKEDANDIRWGIMAYDELSKTRFGSCYKYLGSTSLSGDGKAGYTAVNIKLCRLSEIYLIAAEAAFRTGNLKETDGAAYYLNQIRKRSPNLAAATESTVTLDMILSEKSKELFGEGQRYWDLIRCNKSITYNDVIDGGEGELPHPYRESTIDRTFFRTILPISQDDINADANLVQNPGY